MPKQKQLPSLLPTSKLTALVIVAAIIAAVVLFIALHHVSQKQWHHARPLRFLNVKLHAPPQFVLRANVLTFDDD